MSIFMSDFQYNFRFLVDMLLRICFFYCQHKYLNCMIPPVWRPCVFKKKFVGWLVFSLVLGFPHDYRQLKMGWGKTCCYLHTVTQNNDHKQAFKSMLTKSRQFSFVLNPNNPCYNQQHLCCTSLCCVEQVYRYLSVVNIIAAKLQTSKSYQSCFIYSQLYLLEVHKWLTNSSPADDLTSGILGCVGFGGGKKRLLRHMSVSHGSIRDSYLDMDTVFLSWLHLEQVRAKL